MTSDQTTPGAISYTQADPSTMTPLELRQTARALYRVASTMTMATPVRVYLERHAEHLEAVAATRAASEAV